MHKNRLEAFSDGVLAIIMTLMVLQLKIPEGYRFEDILPLLPTFLSYVLSFVYLGIYWNNHHHLVQAVRKVTGSILWANLHLLFWLSLLPFATGWMGSNATASLPSFVYGSVLFMASVAYHWLQYLIIRAQGQELRLKAAIGRDLKGKASMSLYFLAMVLALVWPWVSQSLYLFLALLWLVPDQRIERTFQEV